VLTRGRALGLTRPGGVAAGLGEDFALHRDDVPLEPEPGEPGRDLPAEILRQICAHLPRIASAEMRTGIELAIDSNRGRSGAVADEQQGGGAVAEAGAAAAKQLERAD